MSVPTITADRLSLRRVKIDDDKEIFFLRSDERILKYLDIPVAETIEDARKFIEKINNGIDNNECYYWGIALKNKSELIGTICIWNISKDGYTADVGYVLHPDFQGKGLMQEAMAKVIDYGFENLKLHSIDADVDPNNSKSITLLVNSGFILSKKFEKTAIYSLANNKTKK